MNSTVRLEIVEILTRKHQRVKAAQEHEFAGQCVGFVKWLVHEPFIRPYLLTIRDRVEAETRVPEDVARALVPSIVKARESLERIAPEICAASLADGNDNPHSLRTFDKKVAYASSADHAFEGCNLMLGTLRGVISDYRNDVSRGVRQGIDALAEPIAEIEFAYSRLQFANNELAVSNQNSARLALERVLRFCRIILRTPDTVPTWLDFVPDDNLAVHVFRDDYRKNKARLEQSARADVDLLIGELENAITSAAADMVLIDRFAQRCALYDRQRLCESKDENALTLELARFLHDQGATVWVRPRFGNAELDATIDMGTRGFVVEAKRIAQSAVPSDTRNSVIKGYRQLHGYLAKLEGKGFDAPSGALVIFRQGGPLPIVERDLPIGRFLIHARTVDVGDSSVSGSRQEPPLTIDTNDIFAAIKSEEPIEA